jgi:hypothetical protein
MTGVHTSEESSQENSDDCKEAVFVQLIGLSPGDIPMPEEWDGSSDAGVELANDIHQLIQEDYPFDVDGVATCINNETHQTLNRALNGEEDR